MVKRVPRSNRAESTPPSVRWLGEEERHLVFSFKHLDRSLYAGHADASFFVGLLDRLREISRHAVEECWVAGHHTVIGTEVLPLETFSPAVQRVAKEGFKDVGKLTVFRAAGDNRAMAGVLLGGVFYIIGIEAKINTLYRHGKRK